jgi:quinol-cytochrome oxidoreductase complex cytochrome b subunit
MFKRIQFEEWQAIITMVAFFVFFFAFIYFCWRALRMGRDNSRHLAQLPLESENTTELTSHERSQE